MIEFECNNEIYTGFEKYQIYRSIHAVAGSFYLSYRLDKNHAKKISFKKGQQCKIKLYKELVLTGYINTVNKITTQNNSTIHISGRSKHQDIVDCSPKLNNSEYRDQSIKDIFAALCSPYNIQIKNFDLSIKINKWSVDYGLTVWENIEELSRKFGVLINGNSEGDLELLKISKIQEETQLIEGENVVKINELESDEQQFSEYIVKGQSPDLIIDSEGIASDLTVKRQRTKVILSENPVNILEARVRAQWESVIRNSRSNSLIVDVNSHLTSPNSLIWKLNRRTTLISDTHDIYKEFLISSVKYEKRTSGVETTSLQLERLDAFKLKASISEVEDR